MLKVGLTGGIGSGKSTVSRLLASHGAVIVDADAIAREVVAPGTPGLAAVLAAFGPGVRRADGTLDRDAVGALVFSDPQQLAALNAIVHPLVGARMDELEEQARREGARVVVHDVPLLAENHLAPGYDVVVVVDCPVELQVARLTGLRGMTEKDALARIAAQASRQERLAIATYVLVNDGTQEQLGEQVAALWAVLAA